MRREPHPPGAPARRRLLVAAQQRDQLLVDLPQAAHPTPVFTEGLNQRTGLGQLGCSEVRKAAAAPAAGREHVVRAVPAAGAAHAALLAADPVADEERSRK